MMRYRLEYYKYNCFMQNCSICYLKIKTFFEFLLRKRKWRIFDGFKYYTTTKERIKRLLFEANRVPNK